MRRMLLVATLLAVGMLPLARPGGVSAHGNDPLTCNYLDWTILEYVGFGEVVHGTGGSDVIIVLPGSTSVPSGGALLKTTAQFNTVYGYGGNDTICVFFQDTIVYGGSGNDWVSGGGYDGFVPNPPASKDWLNPAVMGRLLFGGLYGDAGHDYVADGDLLYGGSGNDTLENGEECYGSAGTDTAINCDFTDRVEHEQETD
jgi:Ca2+-binding RTX toxin-like protein